MKLTGFDWDSGNINKAQKHGLTIDEIEDFFTVDPFIYIDQEHSRTEVRYIAFEKFKSRHVFLAFTVRKINDDYKIRVISARYAHNKEVKNFNETKK